MSRIGRRLIDLPAGVTVTVGASDVSVKGPKGSLSQSLVAHTAVGVEGNIVTVTRVSEIKQARANHGLMRALLNNMVVGVHTGFTKQLEVIGVGYRSQIKGRMLLMSLGYSHPIEYAFPDGIDISVDKKGIITVSGIDKQVVGQVAAKIRGFRKPDHYKGKGVRYVGEQVRLKAGKSA
jgi:large subunit ribosomal protein L6